MKKQKEMKNNEKIKLVVYSNEDESWQFLSGRQLNTEDARVVSLEEIIIKYPLYETMYILPKGYVASKTKNKWIITKEQNG